jgi:hypothetical protein
MDDTFDPAKEGRRIVKQVGEPNVRQVSGEQVAAEAAAVERQKQTDNSKGGSSKESSKG